MELLSSFFAPEVRDRTRALIKKHKFEIPIVYNGGVMHEPEGARKTIQATLDVAEIVKPLGTEAISFNANPKRERKTDEELAVQAKSLDELGVRLRERKLRLLVHEHAPELRESAREWRYQLQHTGPKNMGVCLDVDWVKRGGQDVMTILKECGPRLGSLHVRTMHNGVWTEEFSDGDIDHREVAAYLKKTGFQGVISVELAWEKDTQFTRSLEENLRRSREYAEKVFL
jgi:sugar phosphate isomerase/epimerase